jgi:hypothetical protein
MVASCRAPAAVVPEQFPGAGVAVVVVVTVGSLDAYADGGWCAGERWGACREGDEQHGSDQRREVSSLHGLLLFWVVCVGW